MKHYVIDEKTKQALSQILDDAWCAQWPSDCPKGIPECKQALLEAKELDLATQESDAVKDQRVTLALSFVDMLRARNSDPNILSELCYRYADAFLKRR